MPFSMELGPSMTPDKSKKPLPSSTLIIFPEQPATYHQWKATLQRLKVSYLKGQWKDCALKCSQLLAKAESPVLALHAAFLHFYHALSNESMARLTHPFSGERIRLLEQAKLSYQSAASLLPTTGKEFGLHNADDDCSWSAYSSNSEILDYYQSSPRLSTPEDNASSRSSIDMIDSNPSIFPGKPSLETNHGSNYCMILSTCDQTPSATQTISPSPKVPLLRPTFTASYDSPFRWFHISSIERYTADLTSLADLLTNHIQSVDALIKTAKEGQATRCLANRLASFSKDGPAKAIDLEIRIARLKASGWRRERFRPGRYQELCERALEELY